MFLFGKHKQHNVIRNRIIVRQIGRGRYVLGGDWEERLWGDLRVDWEAGSGGGEDSAWRMKF